MQRSGGKLDGRVAVVTGGASGMGRSTVLRFLDEGASVVVADLNEGTAKETLELAAKQKASGRIRFVRTDVSREADVEAMVELAITEFGRLDVMFNNAGVIGAIGPIAETDSDAWRRSIDILLHSVFYGCKHAAKVMLPRGSGSIISTTSIAGVIGGLGPHAYTAAKTAVVGLTKSVASEVGRQGVRANAIAPGTIPTALTAVAVGGGPGDTAAVAEQSLQRYGIASDPSDIANAALYLASDESRLVNGHTLVVDAGRSINGGSARFASADAGMVDIARTEPS